MANDLFAFMDSLPNEPVSNDLKAEFVLYLKHKFNIPQEGNKLKTNGWNPSPYDLLDIAKHFAQWQKEQMIDKACEWLENLFAPDGSIIPENIKRIEDFKNYMK